MKTNYRAVFSDGATVEIKSNRKCSVAYKLTTPKGVWHGVSVSEKAAMQQIAEQGTHYRPRRDDKSKWAIEARAANEAYRAQCKIEIVPVQI
jgi:hypothetical protein